MNLSIVSLIISNLMVVTLAIIQKWDISIILWVYWMQSIIIGLFQFLRILSLKKFSTENFKINNKPALPTPRTKIFTAFFFLFHYGFFHFIYAILLFNLFTKQPVDLTQFFLGGLIFFLNHLFSYRQNEIIDGQKIQNIRTLMFAPYARIVPMHLVIILGAVSGQSALIFFLLLKTFMDLLMHIIKHKVNYSLNLK